MFTLILPHFLRDADETLPALHTPAFNQLLRFGHVHTNPHHKVSQLYQQYLNIPILPENQAFAIPIWQQMGMNNTQMLDSRSFTLPAEEAEILCQDLNDFYGTDAQFHLHTPEIWQITLPEMDTWHIDPVFDVCGQTDGLLRSEQYSTKQWLKLNTEIQMFLHQHPINQSRSTRGEVPVNGLWLWQHTLSRTQAFQTALIGSNSAWAQIGRLKHSDVPYDFVAWQSLCKEEQVDINQTTLLSEDFVASAHTGDVWSYAQQLHNWENHFFAPIADALFSGSLKGLNVICEHGKLTIPPKAQRAFWKRKKTFNGKSLN
ncbi:MAG: hypothetical protein Q4B82_06715 [Alysiella sp.]|uniref:hypothetical protein n=1 Tax=Alysiella sp. TaxID=1872483 RepID=UPI0026DDA4D9|nr:hypothetical protein [Alysiella sp.]MDO4434255.1 hypothetical protein [Alysiella sp.]